MREVFRGVSLLKSHRWLWLQSWPFAEEYFNVYGYPVSLSMLVSRTLSALKRGILELTLYSCYPKRIPLALALADSVASVCYIVRLPSNPLR